MAGWNEEIRETGLFKQLIAERDAALQREVDLLEALYDARGWFALDGAGANVRRKIDAAIARSEAARTKR